MARTFKCAGIGELKSIGRRVVAEQLELNERNDIGQLLMLASRDFHRRLAVEIRARGVAEISAAEGAIMTHILSHGPSRMVAIADAKGVRSQSLVKVINELESRGYVLRLTDDSDSRAKLIELTATGKKHMYDLSEATEGVWQQYVDELGLSKTKDIFGGLRTLIASKSL